MAKSTPKDKRSFSTSPKILLVAIIAFVVGITAGVGLCMQSSRVSGKDIEEARTQIIAQYLAINSTECVDPTDPVKPADRVAVFYKYLRVNSLANRAVVRGCNDVDRLLAKTKFGDWLVANVNISLDTRANPEWQKACLIQDITIADDVVRPENSGIDSMNLQQCKKLTDL